MSNPTPGPAQFYGRPCAAMADGRLVNTEILAALPGGAAPAGSRLLTDVDRTVIREAAAMAAAGLRVRLGLSDGALGDPALTDVVARTLAETGARADRLIFKIADIHLGLGDGERGVGDRLSGLGCELSLARFSCGYGAFNTLKSRPISYLLVDGANIAGSRNPAVHQETATAVVNLAKDLGVRTIATGVDDEAAMRRLRALDVDLVEGDFIGPIEPLSWRGHDRAGLMAGAPGRPASRSALEPLRRALDNDSFVTQFEPTADLRTGRTLGHELSLEICEPGGPCVTWATVLATTERFGLSTQLDDRLVERAVELAARGAAVTLDISTASLVDPDLSRRVECAVVDARVDPALLTFELCAESFRSSPMAAAAFVHRMHALGCIITVDHIGADDVDLGFLKRLPVDALKLDGALTSGPSWRDADEHVVRAVVQLAHGLGMTVGAQGIASTEAHRRLEDLGVDHGQGPLFGVPAALGTGTHELERTARRADHGG